jgi:hypothetical protein
MLKEGGNVLVLDEPTNDLDVKPPRCGGHAPLHPPCRRSSLPSPHARTGEAGRSLGALSRTPASASPAAWWSSPTTAASSTAPCGGAGGGTSWHAASATEAAGGWVEAVHRGRTRIDGSRSTSPPTSSPSRATPGSPSSTAISRNMRPGDTNSLAMPPSGPTESPTEGSRGEVGFFDGNVRRWGGRHDAGCRRTDRTHGGRVEGVRSAGPDVCGAPATSASTTSGASSSSAKPRRGRTGSRIGG